MRKVLTKGKEYAVPIEYAEEYIDRLIQKNYCISGIEGLWIKEKQAELDGDVIFDTEYAFGYSVYDKDKVSEAIKEFVNLHIHKRDLYLIITSRPSIDFSINKEIMDSIQLYKE